MRLPATVPLLLTAALISACGPRPNSGAQGRFPATGEAPGWARTAEPRTFDADHLWQYIDGDAEKYIRAGVETTLTADFRYQDNIDATADIFVMKSPDRAKEILDSEPSVGGRPLSIGDAGRGYRASLMFRKGRYFVRLVAYQSTPEVDSALLALARAIAVKLE